MAPPAPASAAMAAIDGTDIVYHDFVNISVAVAGPKGLVTPVIRGCESKTIAEIERALGEAAGKARDGTLAMEDFDGGTFTISNGGERPPHAPLACALVTRVPWLTVVARWRRA